MSSLSQFLDVAILKPEMTPDEVLQAARLSLPHHPKTLCVRPCDIPLLRPLCREHGVGLCVVLGFPHGDQLPSSKADEARRYVEEGVDEIDMVCNIGLVRASRWDEVRADIEAVSRITRPAGIPLKVIFETVFLDPDQIRALTAVCIAAHADYIKTSTGFNGAGANPESVRLMLDAAASRIHVKPSGGIRDRAQAEAFLHMGATRLGVGFSSLPTLCQSQDPLPDPDPGY